MTIVMKPSELGFRVNEQSADKRKEKVFLCIKQVGGELLNSGPYGNVGILIISCVKSMFDFDTY